MMSEGIYKSPDCGKASYRAHKWSAPHSLLGGDKSNPGVFGRHDGLVVRRVCKWCGCYRVSRAHDPVNWEVYFEGPDEASAAWIKGRIIKIGGMGNTYGTAKRGDFRRMRRKLEKWIDRGIVSIDALPTSDEKYDVWIDIDL